MLFARPASSVQDHGDSVSRAAGPLEHLPPPNADGDPIPAGRDVEIPVQIAVALQRGVVEQPAVELDHQSSVVDVTLMPPAVEQFCALTLTARQSMRTFDASEVSVLEG